MSRSTVDILIYDSRNYQVLIDPKRHRLYDRIYDSRNYQVLIDENTVQRKMFNLR